MNGAWTDVQNWLDLIDHIWIGLIMIAVAAIPSFFAHRNSKGIQKIQDQVVNGHKSPMRSDLDRVIEAIETISHRLTEEESRRREEVRELREELDRKFSDLLQRFIR